ncbi:MAG: ribosome biogenesis GTPase Der [Syntrophobacteraceae bacterium]|nr:ribosome biogenesis GTPase Der [Desulfobacteraceae bacterium]
MALVAIVGRPNVGKSTLFNRINRKNQALVDDFPGVTRDRNYARITWDDKTFDFVDTGGFVHEDSSLIEQQTREQVLLALDEADILLFVADAKTGLHPEDSMLFDLLRRTSKPVFFAVNKIDGPEQTRHMAEFYELGPERLYPISSAHGFGIGELMTDLAESLPAGPEEKSDEEEANEIRVAIVGRPNVGKSTLVNRILGEPRVIVSPVPGTTRDSVDSPFEHHGQKYVLIDTAGIRRKGRTKEKIEKISVMRALQSVDRSHVAVILIDALEGITDQDLHIAGYIQDRSRACVVAINKWDAVDTEPRQVKRFLDDVKDRFRFFPFAPILKLSAATGKGVPKLIPTIREVFQQYNERVTTGVVNRALEKALQHHEPPQAGGRRLKFFYATQASVRPPTFVLFCNYPEMVHFSYERFLINQLREAFGLDKTPIRLLFRGRQREERKE